MGFQNSEPYGEDRTKPSPPPDCPAAVIARPSAAVRIGFSVTISTIPGTLDTLAKPVN
jgi:hypothetical protein